MENKVIFESEEQLVNFWKDVTGCDPLPGTRERTKQAGYIRKTAVEEAEEMYIRRAGVVDTLHITQQAAIQELKSEIARLKK